jgi:hypothetical protein
MRRCQMIQPNKLFAKKLELENAWNRQFLENGGYVTVEMAAIQDQLKVVVRQLKEDSVRYAHVNLHNGENHSFAG